MDTAKKTALTRTITISPTASAYPTHSCPASRVVTNRISSLGRQLQGVNHLIANAQPPESSRTDQLAVTGSESLDSVQDLFPGGGVTESKSRDK